MLSIDNNIAELQKRIAEAAKENGRNAQSVNLLAVSKTQPAAAIRQAYQCGLRGFGENYLQEALEKQAQLKDLDIEWHYIGAIQSNKTAQIAKHFDWVHTVDRLKIAQRLNDQRPDNLSPLKILIQVNIDAEDNKAGLALNEVPALVRDIVNLPRLEFVGLMTIPAKQQDYEQQVLRFNKIAQMAHTLNQLGYHCGHLSMGMSADLEAAIAAGSTIVRIGTALFGSRPLKPHD